MGYSTNNYFGLAIVLDDKIDHHTENTTLEEVNIDTNGKEYPLEYKYAPDSGLSLGRKVKKTITKEKLPFYIDEIQEIVFGEGNYDRMYFISDELISDEIGLKKCPKYFVICNETDKYKFSCFLPNDAAKLIFEFHLEFKTLLEELKKHFTTVAVKIASFLYYT
jgi:hypothetical protein